MGTGCSSDKSSGIDGQSHPHNMLKAQIVPALKIAIVGDPAVGKTSIILRYTRNQFSPLYIATQRAIIENRAMKVNLPSHAVLSLTLWDIPGREDIDLYKSYFRNLDAAIVVVDVSDYESVMMANVWKQIIMNNIEKTPPPGGQEGEITQTLAVDPEKFPVLLLGTKCDIVEQQLQAEGKSLYPKGKRLKDTNYSKMDDSTDQPESPVEKPECVQQLEKLAEEHNFVGRYTLPPYESHPPLLIISGSLAVGFAVRRMNTGGAKWTGEAAARGVMVSARDGDGSVHTAIQSFLRHILEDQFMERRWKSRGYSAQDKQKDNMDKGDLPSKLETIGIEQIDKAFNGKELTKIFDRIDKLKQVNDRSLKKFQSLCVEVELVGHDEGASLENCIVALRRFLAEADFKLHLVEKKNLCQLKIERLNKETQMSKILRNILNTFNKEYIASGAAIQQEFPPLEENLEKVDAKVEAVVASYEKPVEPGTPADNMRIELRAKSSKIEKNRGLIQYYRNHAQQCREHIDGLTERVRTAFMW